MKVIITRSALHDDYNGWKLLSPCCQCPGNTQTVQCLTLCFLGCFFFLRLSKSDGGFHWEHCTKVCVFFTSFSISTIKLKLELKAATIQGVGAGVTNAFSQSIHQSLIFIWIANLIEINYHLHTPSRPHTNTHNSLFFITHRFTTPYQIVKQTNCEWYLIPKDDPERKAWAEACVTHTVEPPFEYKMTSCPPCAPLGSAGCGCIVTKTW